MLGLGWLGCATADNEVDAVPKKKPDGGADTGGSGDGGGGGSDTAPAPLCGETGTPNACAAAVDLGTLALGAKKTIADAVPAAGGELWFKVKFGDLENLKAHPRVRLTTVDPSITVTVVRSCAGEPFACGGGDASSSARLVDFEIAYALVDPLADAGDGEGGPLGPDPASPADAFVPLSSRVPETVYFKVTRNAAKPVGCDFTVDLSN